MRKNSVLWLSLLAFPLFGYAQEQAQGVITLETAKAVGEELSVTTFCTSINEPVIIDWGDGVEKSYTIDPNGWGYEQEQTEAIKGQTIKIKGNIKCLRCNEQQLTSFSAEGLTSITELDISENQITEVDLCEMPELVDFDMSKNKLTALTLTGMPKLETLNLSYNEIDSHELYISSLAENLVELNVSSNKLVTLNLNAFSNLEYFYASNNPDLTTVVFYDGSTKLRIIDMSDCYIMHFYGISLPNLSQLLLSNNALLDWEVGDYPNLTSLSVIGNQLTSIDVTKYPKLYQFSCSNNRLSSLNLSNNQELITLMCSDNELTALDLSVNTEISTLDVANNNLAKLDITMLGNIQELNISGNPLRRIDLTNAYYLQAFEATDTQCDYFYFNYVSPSGTLEKIDIRNNPRMTSDALSMMYKTMPAHADSWSSEPTLLIEGSNGEHSDTDYVTSSDMQWKVDVEGDGTAQNAETDVTINATLTDGTVHVEGQTGGNLLNDGVYDFPKYTTGNGAFAIAQWQAPYYQALASVSDKANVGVPICIFAEPAEGYKFKSVTVNGEEIEEDWFVINGPSTIKVNFTLVDKSISFTTDKAGRTMQFSLAADAPNTKIAIDWGNGSRQEAVIGNSSKTYIDGTSAGETITIYGDVTHANFESYELPNTDLIDNEITSIDLSKNDGLRELCVYGNPLTSLDVTNQKSLVYLDCAACYELTELDIAENTQLVYLDCHGNKIGNLDLSNCSGLVELIAFNNELTEIDFGNNPELMSVKLTNNKLTSLDVSNLAKLEELEANGNMLAEVDVENNGNLVSLSLGDNDLTSLDLSTNTKLQSLSFNDNAIHSIDLSMLRELGSINCGGNGMTACEMDDFYWNLPEFPYDEDEITGTTLTVQTGEEETPNDARNADSFIATNKGWIVNITGNASGCDEAYITVIPSVNGSIALTDVDGNPVESGDKVKKNSPISVTATPDDTYELDAITLNGERIDGTEFTIARASEISALFKKLGGIDSVDLEGVSINGGNQEIVVFADTESKVEVYNLQGANVFAGNESGELRVPVASGVYAVRVSNGQGTMVKVVAVK